MVVGRAIPLAVVASVFGPVAIITGLLRCYVRGYLVKAFGIDDVFMSIALPLYLSLTICVFLGIHFGSGHHTEDLDPASASRAYLLWWLNYLTYGATITLARTSIGFFFLRITVAWYHRYLIIVTLGSNILTGLVFLGVNFFQCYPVSYFWLQAYDDAQGSCIPIKAYVGLGYLFSAACASIDLTYCLLPIHLIWSLDMPKNSKRGLYVVLSMAGVAGCAPLVRLAYLPSYYDPDFFYATIDIAVWSTIEPGLAITASSLATLRPLLRVFHTAEHTSSAQNLNITDVNKKVEHMINRNSPNPSDGPNWPLRLTIPSPTPVRSRYDFSRISDKNETPLEPHHTSAFPTTPPAIEPVITSPTPAHPGRRKSWWKRIDVSLANKKRRGSQNEALDEETTSAVSPHAMVEFDEIMRSSRTEAEKRRGA